MQEASLRGPRNLSADLLSWPAGQATTVLLFIPGNPGLVHYYTHFLTSLQDRLAEAGSDTTIYALSHLGHSTKDVKSSWTAAGAAGLREQVDHKVTFVDELKERGEIGREGQRLVLMGHSIGSWVCCEVLKARPELVSQACLLFPTVSHMATTSNGRRLAPLFSSLVIPPVAMSTALLSWIPQRILRPVVAILAGQTAGTDGANTTAALVASPGTVTAALGMAAEELRTVKDLDVDAIRQYGDRLWWYWAEGETDGWVQGKSVEEIEQVLDQAGFDARQRIRCEDGMKHAFCLRDDHAGLLANKMARWIAEGGTQKNETSGPAGHRPT